MSKAKEFLNNIDEGPSFDGELANVKKQLAFIDKQIKKGMWKDEMKPKAWKALSDVAAALAKVKMVGAGG